MPERWPTTSTFTLWAVTGSNCRPLRCKRHQGSSSCYWLLPNSGADLGFCLSTSFVVTHCFSFSRGPSAAPESSARGPLLDSEPATEDPSGRLERGPLVAERRAACRWEGRGCRARERRRGCPRRPASGSGDCLSHAPLGSRRAQARERGDVRWVWGAYSGGGNLELYDLRLCLRRRK